MTRHTIVISVLMLFASTVYSEEIGTTSQPMVVERKVGIKNLGSKQTWFKIKPQGRDWEKRSLGPKQSDAFPCGERCVFSLTTTGKPPVQRNLVQTKRYGIYWDGDRRVWDIGEASQ